jgi:hypothetical protein
MAKRFRRFFRFRLSTMLLAVTALSIWLAIETQRSRNQARVVAALQRQGASVFFEHRFGGQPWVDSHELAKMKLDGATIDESQGPTKVSLNGRVVTAAPAPDWMMTLFGQHYFVRPTTVLLSISKGDGPLLADVFTLTSLRQLDLGGVKDGDLIGLDRIRGLKVLNLYDRAITDESIPHLARLTSLVKLDLGGTGISHQGFLQLKTALPSCEILGDPADGIFDPNARYAIPQR